MESWERQFDPTDDLSGLPASGPAADRGRPGDGTRGLPPDLPADLPPDADFELLMSYLDGELTPAEIMGLEARLRGEPELADALGRMSAEHAVRQAVWRSLEPKPAEAMKLARRVTASARKTDRWRRAFRLTRFVAAAAACIVCFVAGWIGRSNAVVQAGTGDGQPGLVQPSHPSHGGAAEKNAARDARGAAKAAESFIYQVALTDEAGNITAVQKFDNLEDARNFATDVGRWQAQQQQVQEGRPVVMQSGL